MPRLYQDSSTSYEFGVASTTIVNGMAVETLKIDREPEFEAEGKDQTGSTIAFVVGDYKFNFTASGYLISSSLFALVSDFTYEIDGTDYTMIITQKNLTQSNTEFQKVEVQGVAFEVIGDATGTTI